MSYKTRFYELPRSLIAAHKVPPVAMRSSITRARSPGSTAPTCISILSVPYSKEYSSEITFPDKKINYLDIIIFVKSYSLPFCSFLTFTIRLNFKWWDLSGVSIPLAECHFCRFFSFLIHEPNFCPSRLHDIYILLHKNTSFSKRHRYSLISKIENFRKVKNKKRDKTRYYVLPVLSISCKNSKTSNLCSSSGAQEKKKVEMLIYQATCWASSLAQILPQ